MKYYSGKEGGMPEKRKEGVGPTEQGGN